MDKLLEYVENNTSFEDDAKFFEFALDHIFYTDCIKDSCCKDKLVDEIISDYKQYIS